MDPFRKRAPKLVELREGSWLAGYSEKVFYGLQWLSLATWTYGTRAASHNNPRLKGEETKRARFVECIVVVWLVLGACGFGSAGEPRLRFINGVVCALALVRVGDIFQANVNAHLWDVLRVRAQDAEHVLSLQRSLLLAGINYLEVIVWFSAVYFAFGLVVHAQSRWDYLYFGAITQLTVGYGELQPCSAAKLLAPLQTMLGVMLLAVGVARLVAGIRPPELVSAEKTTKKSDS